MFVITGLAVNTVVFGLWTLATPVQINLSEHPGERDSSTFGTVLVLTALPFIAVAQALLHTFVPVVAGTALMALAHVRDRVPLRVLFWLVPLCAYLTHVQEHFEHSNVDLWTVDDVVRPFWAAILALLALQVPFLLACWWLAPRLGAFGRGSAPVGDDRTHFPQ